jgi:diaminopimelate decarboxylase
VRVNPNVDPHTHEYTTTGKEENKFGIDADRIVDLFAAWAGHPGLELAGLHVHLGSPVPRIEPYEEALAVLLALVDALERRGHRVEVLNLGGGWPAASPAGEAPPVEEYAARIQPLLEARVPRGLRLLIEPGRSIMAESGLLLTRVHRIKRGRTKTFVICDGGMHTLIRPALYHAFHFVWPVQWSGPEPERREHPRPPAIDGLEVCEVVGPICETGDFLARARPLPPVERGDLLAVFSAGAYGMSMASNYNDHGRPAEVLVDGERAVVINERQPLAVLLETERAPREIGAVSSAAGSPRPDR